LIQAAGWPPTRFGFVDNGDSRENLFPRRDNRIMGRPPFPFGRDYFGREWAPTMHEPKMGAMLITAIAGVDMPGHVEFLPPVAPVYN
jgi:hypothetical protein